MRLQGHFCEQIFVSGEPALPESSPIQSVAVGYPSRNIRFMGLEWNWIWLFFVLSLVAGFVFKSVLKTKDRKSTRLNSSHGSISYAVFCLKKKKKKKKQQTNTRIKQTSIL